VTTNDPTNTPRGRSGPERRRLLAVAASAVAVVALLALVAVASRGDGPLDSSTTSGHSPSTRFLDSVSSLLVVAILATMAYALWLVWLARPSYRGRQPKKPASLLPSLITLAIFTALLLAASLLRRDGQVAERPASQEPADGGGFVGSGIETAVDSQEPSRLPEFQWAPVLVVAGLLVGAWIAFAIRRRRRLHRAPTSHVELIQELELVLDEALDDLRAEPDPRRAVVAAYARTERALAAHGLPRQPFEAPRELLARVTPELADQAVVRALTTLTELYEQAKFSSHTIDRTMKDEAIAALVSIREELRAAREGRAAAA
jgi:hypothetical protein